MGTIEEQIVGELPGQSARLRLLVVERHDDTRAMLQRLLAAASYCVHTVSTCADARAVVASLGEPPDVVVAEVDLPDGDGVTLMAELRERYGCRTIAFTGHGMPQDVERCRAAGIDRHLLKPLGVAELRAVVAALGAGGQSN